VKDPEHILKDNPGSVVFAPYAEVLARSGQIEQAMEILRKGIEANPFYAPGYSVLAHVLLQQNSKDEAVDAFLTAVKNDPQRPGDFLSLGILFLKSDETKSRAFLWAAQIFEPQDPEVCALYEQACESIRKGQEPEEEIKTVTGELENADFTRGESQADQGDKSGVGVEEEPEYPRSFNDMPLEDHDITETEGIETEKDEFFDKSIVEETEQEDFLDIIEEYGEAKSSEENLEEVIKDFSKDEITMLPIPVHDPCEEGEGIPQKPVETGKPELLPENPGERVEKNSEEPSTPKDVFEILEEIDEENAMTYLEENPSVRIPGEEEISGDDSPDFYDRTVVDEPGKEDFYDVIEKYGRTRSAYADIDKIVESLGKDSNLDVPPPVTEKMDEGGEDRPSKSEKEVFPEGEISTVSDSKDNIPLEFGIIDDDGDDSKEEKILEIFEEEEYDLSRYGFMSPSKDDSPVLSEEERKELMSLSESEETEHRETEDEPKGGFEESVLISPSNEDSGTLIPEGYYGRLSKEEIDILSSTEKETPIGDFTPEAVTTPEIMDVFEDDLKTFEKMNITTPGTDVIKEMSQFSRGNLSRSATFSTTPENDKKEDTVSLDSVINEYLDALGNKYEPPVKTGNDSVESTPPVSTRIPAQVSEKGKKANANVPLSNSGSYTATMAEIYVSQGHIPGAIDIYASLLERDPGNKQIQSRLKELKNLADHQGDIS